MRILWNELFGGQDWHNG